MSARSREGGYTLTEVLVAVVVMTVGITSIIGAIGSSIFASRVHRDIVTSDAVVRRYAEQIMAHDYVPVAYDYAYDPSGVPPYGSMHGVPVDFTASIAGIDCWDGQSNGADFVPCSHGDTGVQRITIEARRTNGPGFQRLVIVKRAI